MDTSNAMIIVSTKKSLFCNDWVTVNETETNTALQEIEPESSGLKTQHSKDWAEVLTL